MTIAVPAHEAGIVRVFALSMTEAEARAFKAAAHEDGTGALAEALGLQSLDPAQVEVFPLSDLGTLGLAGFLVEGAGVRAEAVAADRLRLAALEGWVMVVYSGAFRGEARTLTPEPRLTLVGSYPQEGVDWSAPVDLSTPSALPTPHPAQRKRPSDAAMSGRVAMAALLVAFLVVGLMVWVGSR